MRRRQQSARITVAVLLACCALLDRRISAAPPPDGWRIRLEASLPGLVDKARLTLGASSSTTDGYDDFDEPHPPALPHHYLDLVTRHESDQPGWGTQPEPSLRYQAQYDSPLGAGGRVLEFVLETNQA